MIRKFLLYGLLEQLEIIFVLLWTDLLNIALKRKPNTPIRASK